MKKNILKKTKTQDYKKYILKKAKTTPKAKKTSQNSMTQVKDRIFNFKDKQTKKIIKKNRNNFKGKANSKNVGRPT